jgi:hypothetical protein
MSVVCKRCKTALHNGKKFVDCPRQGLINPRGPLSANAKTPWGWSGDGECELFGDEKLKTKGSEDGRSILDAEGHGRGHV